MFKGSSTAQLRDRHNLKLNCFLKVKGRNSVLLWEKKGGSRKVGEHAEMEEKGTGTEIKTAK